MYETVVQRNLEPTVSLVQPSIAIRTVNIKLPLNLLHASVFSIYNSTCTRFYMMCTAAKSRIGWRTFYEPFRWIFCCRVALFISISGAVSFTCIQGICIGREWIWWGHRVQLFFRLVSPAQFFPLKLSNRFTYRFSVIQLIKTIVFKHFILS